MNFFKITIAALVGTSFMTAFSYVISESRKKQFREPELLNKLVRRLPISGISPTKKGATGWVLHYVVGFMFNAFFDRIWQKSILKINTKSGLTLGAIFGLFGILIWKLTFKFHPNPPNINLKEFFYQLFIAHLIFGYFSMLGYKFVPDSNEKSLFQDRKNAHYGYEG